MFSYAGSARLIYPDGKTADLDHVRLTEFEDMPGGLRDWSGSATANRPTSSGEARIELPSGEQADILVTNVQVNADAHGVRVTLTLQGSGSPPGAED